MLKVSRKEGITRRVPNKNHGVRLPILVLVLSIKNPTRFVEIPSAIWPERRDRAASPGPNSTVNVMKYRRYMNHTVAHISL